VRNAATIGGNLALARQRRLESDLATVLMGGGAIVRYVELTASSNGHDVRCAASAALQNHPTISLLARVKYMGLAFSSNGDDSR